MKILLELLPIFRIYQFCAFSPFSVPFDAQNRNKYKWNVYSWFLIILLSFLAVYNIVSYNLFIEFDNSEMITYLSFVMITMLRIVSVIIGIESFLNRKQQMLFLLRFEIIDQIFRKELSTGLDYKRIRKNTFIWMGIWIIHMVIVMSLVIAADIIDDESDVWLKVLWIFCTFPLVLSSISYFQIIHYIRLLGFCFKLINNQLETYTKTNKFRINNSINTFESGENKVYDNIVSLRRIYHILWENTKLLNKTFQWSLLLLIGSSFFIIVVNYYRNVHWLMAPDSMNMYTYITYLIWSTGHVFFFIILSSACYNVSQETKQIPVLLHNIAFKTLNQDLNHLVM